jgi:hypothetical protein
MGRTGFIDASLASWQDRRQTWKRMFKGSVRGSYRVGMLQHLVIPFEMTW